MAVKLDLGSLDAADRRVGSFPALTQGKTCSFPVSIQREDLLKEHGWAGCTRKLPRDRTGEWAESNMEPGTLFPSTLSR